VKKRLFGVLAVWIIFGTLALPVSGKDEFPAHRGQVNDFAHLIPPAVEQRMEARAREVLRKTGASIVVVTMPTIGENDFSDYVNRLYRAWGIGKKGEDRGVLLFFALKEKRVRIETGYGVEGILPDGKVGDILRRDVLPYLKKKDYGTGLEGGLEAVARVIEADAGAAGTGRAAPPKKPPVSPHAVFIVATLVFFGIVGLLVFVVVMIRKNRFTAAPSDNRFESIGAGGGWSSGDSGGGDSGGDSGGFDGGDSGGGGAECSTDD
jgi:uncharacterized protein